VDFEGSTRGLDNLINLVVESEIVSIFSVHEYVRYICKAQFPNLIELIDNYYTRSSQFMGHVTTELRSRVASGAITSEQDIKLILKNTDTSNPNVTWDSFFILAAKFNHQPADKLLQAFKATWKSNSNHPDRWKLILKMAAHNLLVNETVFFSLVEGQSWREWEVYLGCIVESDCREDFKEFWNEVGGTALLSNFTTQNEEQWHHALKLLEIILNDKEFIPGSIL
jgi:hypothetical protein